MERNPWKLATIGMALVGTTALGTGLTTAYMLRTAGGCAGEVAAPTRAIVAPRAVGAPPAVARPAAAPVAARVTPAATTPAVAAADCATGVDRAKRIAKPGAIGGLLGAGLGAAGGAIADGGSGAGKGALIGGLAGAVLGGGYGAYQTKNECGTIFGNTFAGPARRPRRWRRRPSRSTARGSPSKTRANPTRGHDDIPAGPGGKDVSIRASRPRTVSRAAHPVSACSTIVRAWYRGRR